LLSRLYRKAEALDSACLRARGYPTDNSIREELLSALEWDKSLRPEHARASIRELFDQVHEISVALASRIRASADLSAKAHITPSDVEALRRDLAALMRMLEARRPGNEQEAKATPR
jgi:hypothetical protein